MQAALVVKSPIGWFAFSESGELILYKLFDAYQAFEQFDKEMPEDFKERLQGYAVKLDAKAERFLRPKLRQFAKQLGFSATDAEFSRFMAGFATALSKKRLVGIIGRDKLMIQATGALDDANRASNSMLVRLAEWFGLHYPELKLSHEKLVDVVQEYGRRENFPGFKGSAGVALTEHDAATLREFATAAAHMLAQKKHLERYVRESMRTLAPNFSSLIDEVLAARLLASAGSLEKLAKMSASTIQLIGAEKALFRHLKRKGKAPKFGLIFMSDWIQAAPEALRGKVARALAAKLMMAARIDYYSGRNESERLRRELEQEIAALQKGALKRG
ncbi:MAG: rRNA biogenesis protein [Candidatus Aenigmatarchaeota archaeon]